MWQPYFQRQPGLFSSHNQTPADKPTGYPVSVLSADDKIGYLYGAVFQGYRDDAFYVYKALVGAMLKKMLPEPLIQPGANVPAAMEIALLRQDGRIIAHLVDFRPQRRTAANEFIESATPTGPVTFAVRTETAPSAVTLEPGGKSLAFTMDGAYCHVTVPSVSIHGIVAFEGV